jgi:dolichol-phosphate mannosyltransferase
MEDKKLPDVVTVILAKNEEPTIGDAVAGAVRHCGRVLVMDGHSSDATADVARSAGAEVHLDPGPGKGAAIRSSFELVSEAVVVLMDADGSHDPADIPRLATPVLDGSSDLCVGSRFTGGSEELSITIGQLLRTVGNISMNIAINRRWGVELTDTLNGFRAVRRDAAIAVGLREDIHTIEQEMVMKMLLAGYRVTNVPTHEDRRQYGESHIRIWREWPLFVLCVLTHVLRRSRPVTQDPAFGRSRTSTDSS